MRNTCVMSWGAGPPTGHGPRLARQLGVPYYQLPNVSMPACRNVIFVGVFPGDLNKINELSNTGEYVIYPMFIGSDVLEMLGRHPDDPAFDLVRGTEVLVVADHLQNELNGLNIPSEVATLVPDEPEIVIDFDVERRGILYYCPPIPFKHDLFMLRDVVEIARGLGDFYFYCYGGAEIETRLDNWENVGFVTGEALHDLYRKVRYNLRPTKHDGYPQSIIQLARLGIPTLTTYCFPHTGHIDVANVVPSAIEVITNGHIDLEEMQKFYTENFTVREMVSKFEEIIGEEE